MDNLQNQDSPATPLQGFDAIESFKVDGASLKGYRLQDFQDAWERYAGPLATSRDRENSVAAS